MIKLLNKIVNISKLVLYTNEQIIFYIAMTLNIIMFIFFLLIISLGISDELASDMVEKTRLFFAFGKLDPYLLSVFGILLPFLNMYFLFKSTRKLKEE